jgi:hypothetical protein
MGTNEVKLCTVRKNMLYWANRAKAGQKSLVLARQPNNPTKEGPISYLLLDSPFASVSAVSRGNPSLGSIYSSLTHDAVVNMYSIR